MQGRRQARLVWLPKGSSYGAKISTERLLDQELDTGTDYPSTETEAASQGLPSPPVSPAIKANWSSNNVDHAAGHWIWEHGACANEAELISYSKEIEPLYDAMATPAGCQVLLYGHENSEVLEMESIPSSFTSAISPRPGAISPPQLRPSGNPFTEENATGFLYMANPLYGQQLQRRPSMPEWCNATSLQPAHHSTATATTPQAGAEALNQAGILDTACFVGCVDPCAEVLINTFAEYSRDISSLTTSLKLMPTATAETRNGRAS